MKKIINEKIMRLEEETQSSPELFNKLPWDELAAEMSKRCGVNIELSKDEDVRNIRGEYYQEVKSQNLLENCGIFTYALNGAYLETTASTSYKYPGVLWGTCNLRYETKDGGTNGISMFRWSWGEEKGFKFSGND